jgi:hypothetical protein
MSLYEHVVYPAHLAQLTQLATFLPVGQLHIVTSHHQRENAEQRNAS